jgi:hypothetical protein
MMEQSTRKYELKPTRLHDPCGCWGLSMRCVHYLRIYQHKCSLQYQYMESANKFAIPNEYASLASAW